MDSIKSITKMLWTFVEFISSVNENYSNFFSMMVIVVCITVTYFFTFVYEF